MPEGVSPAGMSLELEHECPECGETRTFWKVASMEVHLGTKMKWDCPECDYGFVQIDGNVDSSVVS
jgi:rubredoxin